MKKIASGYRLIFGYLGIFLAVTGVIILLPLLLLVVPEYRNDSVYVINFLIPGLATLLTGIALYVLLLVKREKAQLMKHQDSILLVLIWLVAILVSAVPFIMTGKMSVTESIFESTSGYASVGLTRLPLEMYDSHIFTFYRAILQFFGGVGLVLIVTSAISDRYGLKLYTAEGHNDRLIPNLGKSARIILSMYVGFIILGMGALMIAGVDWFDALTHSISSIATGGFSSKANGMAGYSGNQMAIEIITCVLMILGATNFLLHFMLLLGRFKKVGKDIEIKTFGIIVLIFVPLMFLAFFTSHIVMNGVLSDQTFSVGESFRYGTFTFISCITTTGYSNVPVGITIPSVVFLLLAICNVIGGGMGSTAGGVKFYRIGIACKSYYWTLRAKLSPKRFIYPTYITRYGDLKEIHKDDSNEAFGYILLYVLVVVVGAFLVSVLGSYDFGSSLFEFSTALSGTGLSNGITTGANGFAAANNAVLWVLNVGMFAGRLEILAIYYAIFRIARDIFRKETI